MAWTSSCCRSCDGQSRAAVTGVASGLRRECNGLGANRRGAIASPCLSLAALLVANPPAGPALPGFPQPWAAPPGPAPSPLPRLTLSLTGGLARPGNGSSFKKSQYWGERRSGDYFWRQDLAQVTALWWHYSQQRRELGRDSLGCGEGKEFGAAAEQCQVPGEYVRILPQPPALHPASHTPLRRSPFPGALLNSCAHSFLLGKKKREREM